MGYTQVEQKKLVDEKINLTPVLCQETNLNNLQLFYFFTLSTSKPLFLVLVRISGNLYRPYAEK